jgi:muconolactone delta-isomerase
MKTTLKGGNAMKYLVTMELTGSPPMTTPQELVKWLEQMVIPSEEAVMRLETEGKVLAGGDMTGRRGWAAIMEAASNEELSQLLESIPEWPLLKVEVTPLESTESRLAHIRQELEQLKKAQG